MSKETLLKYANKSQYNKKKCYALGNWCNKQGNTFSMQEVFDCLYDFANGSDAELTKLIEQLTSKGKVYGRSSVVFGDNDRPMHIVRNENGRLEIKGYRDNFTPNAVGQHPTHNDTVIRKDGQIKKNVINSREKLVDLGKEVRLLFPNQSNELLTAAMNAIKNYAKEHKISELLVVDRLKKGTYTLDNSDGLDNSKIISNMKTIKLNERQLNDITEATKLTEYKFYHNVQRFLSDLLKDPVGAKVPFLLQMNNITRNQLLYHLKSRGIINRFQKINDKDSEGNPKTARMVIRYSVPRKDFAKKMKKLFIDLVAKNVPEKKEDVTEENERFKDQLNLMKGSPLTMGVIGHPKYRQTDKYAEIMNKKIQDKKLDECDGGAAPSGATNCQSSGAFVQPMFGVQRRKMPNEIEEDTTASTVTQNGDISMGVAVPFGSDKETKDRTPGFSVERQDECKHTLRFNIDGKEVPYKCTKCGGDVVKYVRGIGTYVCENCYENYGVLPIGKYMKDDNIDTIIREAVAREIQDVLLNEEHSINNEVDKEANNVYNIICDYKYTEKDRVEDDACDTVYQTTLQREFLGKNILYIVRYYVFNDDKRHNLDCGCSVIDKHGGTIFINYDLECCPMSYGDLHDSVQHELTHLFKLMMAYGKSSRHRPISEKIVPLINDFYNSPNKLKKVIGCVFYMGLNDEQDAYINGLYASIKNALLNGIQPHDVVKQSPLYQKVRELINIKNNLDSYFSNEEFLKYVETFNQYLKYNKGLTKETFLKKINYTLERIKKKFFNMIKAYQKFILSGGMIVHGDIVSLIIQQFLS